MKRLKKFDIKIKDKIFSVNAETETQAKWSAVALFVGRGDCTDAEFQSSAPTRVLPCKEEN